MTTGAAHDQLEDWRRETVRALDRRDFKRAHGLCLQILTHQPETADAFFLLGMIAAEHRNYAKAAELIERALTLDPGRAEYHAHLGRCLVALRRPGAAFKAAAHALALEPADALTLDTIGVVMTHAGAHAEALEPFRRATEIDPGKAAYFYNLGASLQFAGRFTEAAESYRRALALDPADYRAWLSLAQVARAPLSPMEVATLEAVLASNTLDANAELHVCHALAKQSEDQGDFTRAFAYLQQAKTRKRREIRHSPDADSALFSAAATTAGFGTGSALSPGCSSAEPFFIVGMPRTGTTLIERILSNHPSVFSAGELSNFSLVLKRAARTPSALILDPGTLVAGSKADLAKVGAGYVESTRPRTGHTRHFIDKMPLNFFYAGLIHRALPNAKIICLRRNPLDTVLSNYRQLFATSFSYYNYAYDLLDAGRYYIGFDRLARHWLETIPANYCEVHYESVVADTEKEARRLVDFCGLEWDPACLRFEENAAPVATASSVQVRQPIYRTAVERWRKYEKELQPLIELFATEGILKRES